MRAAIETFRRVADSGRVGQPVFFRCLIGCPKDQAEAAVAWGLAAAVSLLGDRPQKLFVRGDRAAGALHALLDFAGGACALVAVAPGAPAWEAMLLGNHGAAYLESAAALRRECRESASREACWRAAIARSLAEGGPVPVEEVFDA